MNTRRTTRRYHRVKLGNMCLDVEGGSRKTRARVIAWKCHSGPNQKFRMTKRGEWQAKHSRKCVNTRTFRQKVCRK